MEATARSSRLRLAAILSAVAAVHAVVLLTSELEGPGSAQLRLETAASAGGWLLALRPDQQILLVAAAAAVALACATLLLGARLAPTPPRAAPARATAPAS